MPVATSGRTPATPHGRANRNPVMHQLMEWEVFPCGYFWQWTLTGKCRCHGWASLSDCQQEAFWTRFLLNLLTCLKTWNNWVLFMMAWRYREAFHMVGKVCVVNVGDIYYKRLHFSFSADMGINVFQWESYIDVNLCKTKWVWKHFFC